jgi:hypothetical protein
MGYVVYEKEYGAAQHYYKKESSAKAQVTRLNKLFVLNGWGRAVSYCSWADYELMLQGMNPDDIRFYRFVTHPLNT